MVDARARDEPQVKPFSRPTDELGQFDASAASQLIGAVCDIALVLDVSGLVQDVSLGADDLPADLCQSWVGRPFIDSVSPESRAKISELANDARGGQVGRWRHLNHPDPSGTDFPVLYRAVVLPGTDRLLLVGRDLRATAQLQQRLMTAQQSIERDYSRLRHVQTRYRLLFQIASDPIFVVDAASVRILEANPAASRRVTGDLTDRPLLDSFAAADREAVEGMLAGVRTSGRPDEVLVRTADGEERVTVAASLFRQEASSLFLIRLGFVDRVQAAPESLDAKLLRALADAPDGFVLTASDGRVVHVNAAFLDLAQLATVDNAIGETLDRWIGRSGVDLNVLMANLRERGIVRLFAAEMRGELGVVTEVEISAVSVANGPKPSFAFVIRNIGRRLEQTETKPGRSLPSSVEQLTELVGRVSLKDLVRETTDMIERLYIEAALELTSNNRASAAELLGLSRQSLYVKLNRYGLKNGEAEPEGA